MRRYRELQRASSIIKFESHVNKPLLLTVVLALSLQMTACGDDEAAMQECLERGREFYRAKGNYTVVNIPPNTGRLVEEVVRERCERSTTAFRHGR